MLTTAADVVCLAAEMVEMALLQRSHHWCGTTAVIGNMFDGDAKA